MVSIDKKSNIWISPVCDNNEEVIEHIRVYDKLNSDSMGEIIARENNSETKLVEIFVCRQDLDEKLVEVSSKNKLSKNINKLSRKISYC